MDCIDKSLEPLWRRSAQSQLDGADRDSQILDQACRVKC